MTCVCSDLDRIELIAFSNISPWNIGFFQGGSGTFQCTTRAAVTLRWVINDFDVDFNAVDPVGSSNWESIATAHLVDVGVDSTTFVGNRTSLLIIKPNPNFIGYINVSCSAGG